MLAALLLSAAAAAASAATGAGAESATAAGYTRHADQIPVARASYFAYLSVTSVAACEARCTANATGCLGFTTAHGGDRCWLYAPSVKSLIRVVGDDWWQKPGTRALPVAPIPAPPPTPPAPCTGPTCFSFSPDWKGGGPGTTLPTGNFSVRKLEAIYYPPDGRIYAYVDIVNYTDLYYPASYSAEIGAYSSPDGFTNWSCECPLLCYDVFARAEPDPVLTLSRRSRDRRCSRCQGRVGRWRPRLSWCGSCVRWQRGRRFCRGEKPRRGHQPRNRSRHRATPARTFR